MKILKKGTSIIFTFSLIGLAIILTISFLLKWNLREEEISEYLKDNDLSFVLKNIDGSENSLISDTREMLEIIGIPSETIENVLNSDATKEFLGKYITDILQYLIYDKEKTVLTSEDIKNLAEANFDVIDSTLNAKGLTFNKEQKQKIHHLIEEYADEVMNFFPTANMLLEKLDQKDITIYSDVTLDEITSLIRLLTSKKWILTIIVMMFISSSFIIICNFKNKKLWGYFKVATFSYAFLFIIIQILLGTIIKEELMLKIVSAKDFVNYLVNVLSKNIWIFIIIALLLSITFAKLQKGRKKHAPILERIYNEDKGEIKEENK